VRQAISSRLACPLAAHRRLSAAYFAGQWCAAPGLPCEFGVQTCWRPAGSSPQVATELHARRRRPTRERFLELRWLNARQRRVLSVDLQGRLWPAPDWSAADAGLFRSGRREASVGPAGQGGRWAPDGGLAQRVQPPRADGWSAIKRIVPPAGCGVDGLSISCSANLSRSGLLRQFAGRGCLRSTKSRRADCHASPQFCDSAPSRVSTSATTGPVPRVARRVASAAAGPFCPCSVSSSR